MITTPVLVDGTSVEVTTNLAEALSELRKSRELLVWADALCINQGELYERSYQVQRMGQIYSKARKVISWLGYDGYRSESARVNRDSSGLYKRSGLSVDRNATSHSFLYDNSRLARRLVKSAYWRRIWIIQEVSKASNVEVWCANWTWDLDALLEFFLSRDASLSISDSDRYVLEAIRYIRTRERQSHIAVARMLLSVSLLRSRMSLATDPRDKIYALLSLTLDGNEVVPTPSYRQNVEAIYNDGQYLQL
jgi:hypothetical protein